MFSCHAVYLAQRIHTFRLISEARNHFGFNSIIRYLEHPSESASITEKRLTALKGLPVRKERAQIDQQQLSYNPETYQTLQSSKVAARKVFACLLDETTGEDLADRFEIRTRRIRPD